MASISMRKENFHTSKFESITQDQRGVIYAIVLITAKRCIIPFLPDDCCHSIFEASAVPPDSASLSLRGGRLKSSLMIQNAIRQCPLLGVLVMATKRLVLSYRRGRANTKRAALMLDRWQMALPESGGDRANQLVLQLL
jgi:hypothetical protein